MKYLDIIRQIEMHEPVKPPLITSLRNELDEIDKSRPDTTTLPRDEIDEIDESRAADGGVSSSNSSISFADDVSRADATADAAVATLRYWYGVGALDTLPECIPGFPDELAHYRVRDRLLKIVWPVIEAAPWSLTARERAAQFVAALAPVIGGEP